MSHSPIFFAVVLFGSALLGALIYLLTHRQTSKGIKLLLSFSAAYLLALTMLHLIPEVYSADVPYVGWFVIAGFLLQVILDFFSHGVEHGHAHTHDHKHTGTKFLFTVMASLWVHAFIEGMPFGGVIEHVHAHAHDHGHEHAHHVHDHRDSLLLGIGLHKITETLVFTALLMSTGMSKIRGLFWVLLFALIAPLGAFAHYWMGLSGAVNLSKATPMIIGVLVGILLHVSTTILFESEEGHKFNIYKFGSILLGIAAASMM